MAINIWQGQALSNATVDDQYPQPGFWADNVYHRRKRQRKKITTTKFNFNTLTEQCQPLNGDYSTIGTFTYYQGNHIIIPAVATNYHITLSLQNLLLTSQPLAIVVNNLEVAAISLSATNSEQLFSFDIALTKREFDLTFTNPINPLAGGKVKVTALKLTAFTLSAAEQPRIFIASDSTVQTYTQKEYPQTGWGAVLYRYLFPNGVTTIITDPNASYSTATIYRQGKLSIFNKSIGGRSARSFIEEGKLTSLAQELRPKDYLFIQWGDNDATSYRPMRYASPADFSKQINYYIDTAIDRNVKPILITPPAQCKFEGELGHISFPEYRSEVLKLAKTRCIPCIDLGKFSAQALTALGPKIAPAMYLQFAPKQYPGFPEGIHDQTHFNTFGANILANIVATEFTKLQSTYQLRSLPNSCVSLTSPSGLSARIEDKSVRLWWEPVTGADAYRITRINGQKKQMFTTLNSTFWDIAPGKNPIYRVTACAMNKQPSQPVVISVTLTVETNQATGIMGINIYEVDTQTSSECITFSLRFTAHQNIDSYQVFCFNQRTREKRLLGQIKANNVYALHSYQVPQQGTWLVQIAGTNIKNHQRLLSKSVIVN